MKLPIFNGNGTKDFSLMQTAWSAAINPLLSQPISQGHTLMSVTLVSGANVINHLLGRKLQGWFIVRQRASASVYDTQDSNETPNLTLKLTSSAAVVVDILVF